MAQRQSTTLKKNEVLANAKKGMDCKTSCKPEWIKSEDVER
jgi:hypothetical protein